MYNLNAYAVRKDGVIEVTLSGSLSNSCHSATVKDKYPGGGIVYLVDPGTAQVFVEETIKPRLQECSMSLLPWMAHVSILDSIHDQVAIFVNDVLIVNIDVKEEANDYRIVALTISSTGAHIGCSLIPADAPYLAIYSSVFGPALKADCQRWLQKNCVIQ